MRTRNPGQIFPPVHARPAPGDDRLALAEPDLQAKDFAHVRELEREALSRLMTAAGNTSLCTLSRSGVPRPAAKYHEGAAAALAQVRRAVDRLDGDLTATETVMAVRHRWQTHPRGDSTAAWRAYIDGGLDALDAALGTPSHPTDTGRPSVAADLNSRRQQPVGISTTDSRWHTRGGIRP